MDKPDLKPKIYIAIPSANGEIVPGLVYDLIGWTHDPRYKVRIDIREGMFPHDNARNTMVKEFLELNHDIYWSMDDDIVPPPDALHRLASMLLARPDIDALGAVCFSMKSEKGEYFPYPVTLRYNKEKKFQVYYGQGIEEVDATGGACMMIKRRVFEAIERPYEFVYHKDGTLALTTEFHFAQKMQKKGFKLFIDFNVLCDHQRKCSIKGVQDEMMRLKGE